MILDLDGTITDSEQPCEDPGFRGYADNLIYENSLDGVAVVVSSAWDEPSRTIKTIETLGLSRNLKCDDEKLVVGSMQYQGRELDYYKKGHVCGLKEKGSKYYLLKALAPLLIFDADKIRSFEYVIFVDDSSRNQGYRVLI